MATHASLEQQHVFFREAGDRKRFFDHVNSVRKETFGELAKLPYQHLGLPSNFASLFFLHVSEKREEEATIDSVQGIIADLEQQTAARQAQLKDLQAKADEDAKKAAELTAKRTLAAQFEKAAAEADAQAKAMRAKIAELNL